jgi:hypothetical protein
MYLKPISIKLNFNGEVNGIELLLVFYNSDLSESVGLKYLLLLMTTLNFCYKKGTHFRFPFIYSQYMLLV